MIGGHVSMIIGKYRKHGILVRTYMLEYESSRLSKTKTKTKTTGAHHTPIKILTKRVSLSHTGVPTPLLLDAGILGEIIGAYKTQTPNKKEKERIQI